MQMLHSTRLRMFGRSNWNGDRVIFVSSSEEGSCKIGKYRFVNRDKQCPGICEWKRPVLTAKFWLFSRDHKSKFIQLFLARGFDIKMVVWHWAINPPDLMIWVERRFTTLISLLSVKIELFHNSFKSRPKFAKAKQLIVDIGVRCWNARKCLPISLCVSSVAIVLCVVAALTWWLLAGNHVRRGFVFRYHLFTRIPFVLRTI